METETSPDRQQLLDRDASQRREIAALRSRVSTLEAQKGAKTIEPQTFFRPTQEELLGMARSCMIQFDTPPLLSVDPSPLPPKHGLGEVDASAVQKVQAEVTARTLAQLRAIYVELTGNVDAAEDLDGAAMIREIEEKSGRQAVDEAMKQLSHERAGLLPAPENLAGRPPVERMLRTLSRVGDELEAEVARIVGPNKAFELRAARGGWASKIGMNGCPDQGAGEEEPAP